MTEKEMQTKRDGQILKNLLQWIVWQEYADTHKDIANKIGMSTAQLSLSLKTGVVSAHMIRQLEKGYLLKENMKWEDFEDISHLKKGVPKGEFQQIELEAMMRVMLDQQKVIIEQNKIIIEQNKKLLKGKTG